MNSAREILIDDGLAALTRQVASLGRSGTLDEVFAAWLLPDPSRAGLDATGAVMHAHAQAGSVRQYRDVAILGLACAMSINLSESKGAFEAGLRWLIGRRPFAPDSVPSFEIDAVALLAIAVGIEHVDPILAAAASRWLKSLVDQSIGLPRTDSFDRVLFGAIRVVLTSQPERAPDTSEDAADVRTAMRSKGINFVAPPEADDEVCVLRRLIEAANTMPLPVRAATMLAAVAWVRRRTPMVDLKRATTEELVRLLERVESALRRWTWESSPRTSSSRVTRWDMNNEYHVQNLLWAILAPVFPDLEDEENLPSLGHRHPRFDLGVPSLRTIVEVKFVRSGQASAFSAVIEEVAADASLYRSSNSGYDALIVFVWDDSRATEQHAELRQGLLKINGVVGAVVVSRPGKMVAPAQEQDARQSPTRTPRASARKDIANGPMV